MNFRASKTRSAIARISPLTFAIASTLALGVAQPTEAAPSLFSFKFTPIADTQSGLWEFLSFSPSLNNSGRVAWQGRLVGGVEGIFARVGTGGITTLADTGVDPFITFGLATAINNGGQVLSFGLTDDFDQQLLLGTSAAVPIVKTSAGLFTQLFGFKLNDAGTTAFGAERHDGIDVIFTRNSAGTQKLITGTGSFFSQVDHNPSINGVGTVIFTGTVDTTRGIFKLEPGGSINAVTTSGTDQNFFGLTDVNDAGQVAWTGTKDDGTRGVFRISGSTTTTIAIADSSGPLSAFGGISLNNAGRVALQASLDNGGRQIRIGPSVLSSRIIGNGDVLFGRTVQDVFIDRDALNDNGQVALRISFTNGTSMIARADFVPPVFDNVVLTNAVQVTTAMAGDNPPASGAVTLTKVISSLLDSLTLSFDVRFLAPGSDLTINVNGQPAGVIRAENFGSRTRVKLPVDLRRFRNGRDSTYALQFAYAGKAGATAQIDRVVIRDDMGESNERDGLPDWKVQAKGAAADAIDTTRFPVKVVVGTKGTVEPGKPVPVAILSTEGLDAPDEIDQATIQFVGSPAAGQPKPVCKKTDVDGDGVGDLYCEVGANVIAARAPITLTLEAETTSGMRLIGEQAVTTSIVR